MRPRRRASRRGPRCLARQEVVRSIYDLDDVDLAEEFVCELAVDLQHDDRPLEVRSLGRTLARWFDEITNWHKAFVSNGPTEASTT